MHLVSTKIVPLVVSCLGMISGWFLKDLGIPYALGGMHKQTSIIHWDHPNPPEDEL